MAIFLQRVVGSFVGGAHGAAVFYGNKKSDALGLNHRLLNDHRDEDREVRRRHPQRRSASQVADLEHDAEAPKPAPSG